VVIQRWIFSRLRESSAAHVGQRELSPMSHLRRNHATSNACKLVIWLHSSVLEDNKPIVNLPETFYNRRLLCHHSTGSASNLFTVHDINCCLQTMSRIPFLQSRLICSFPTYYSIAFLVTSQTVRFCCTAKRSTFPSSSFSIV
jgi:hypothetical protein